MKLRKILVAGPIYVLCVTILLWACKHEIPVSSNGVNPNDPGEGGSQPCNPDSVYFQQQILPLIVSNCAKSGCHDPVSRVEGLNLTTYSAITRLVRAGNPAGSELVQVITTNDPGDRMPPPPDPKMPQDQINLIIKWIQQGARNNSCASVCDSSVFTFSISIKPLMTSQCQGCHSGTNAGGGIDLSTYTGVKAVADNGKLWGAVHKDAGFVAMPPAGNGLTECQLTQIKKWIDSGAPNN